MHDSSILARKYGLEPLPESVVRLGRLVTNRNADIQEIIKVLSTDDVLRARLFRAASPTDGFVELESIEEAVLRTGIGCVLVLAMSDPLMKAVTNTFSTFAGIELQGADLSNLGVLPKSHYLGQARFSGRATGSVYIRVPEFLGRQIAVKLLGNLSKDDLASAIPEVLGEIVNMVVGNLKSNLTDAGLGCKLGLPEVTKVSEFKAPEVPLGWHQVFAFKHFLSTMLVDIVVTSTD